ncbi:hypothetical protein [Endozoicomonas sp.]|uniref:hypothetical protein n=1 Tax=Endozoicomonas sp. TaxID=1892382 RepID=UPI002886DAA0|nr:hypothetical protein [Endozoicomonas sp.]
MEYSTGSISYSSAVKSLRREPKRQDPRKLGEHSVSEGSRFKQTTSHFRHAQSAEGGYYDPEGCAAISDRSVQSCNANGSDQKKVSGGLGKRTGNSGNKREKQSWRSKDGYSAGRYQAKTAQVNQGHGKNSHKSGVKVTYKDLRDAASKLKECYYRNEKGVTAERVLDAYDKIGGPDKACSITYFLEKMFTENRSLADDKLVTAEMVANHYSNAETVCEKAISKGWIKQERLDEIRIKGARFYERLLFNNNTLNGECIKPEKVINNIPDTDKGRLFLAHFYNELYIKDRLLESGPVTAEMVDEKYSKANSHLHQTRFYEWLFLHDKKLKGVNLDFSMIYERYGTFGSCESQAIFLSEMNSQKKHGVELEDVFKACGNSKKDQISKAISLAKLYENNETKLSAEYILDQFPTDTRKERICKARFRRDLCLNQVKVDGNVIDADTVINELDMLNATQELGYFYIKLFLQGVHLPGKTSTAVIVKKRLEEMKLFQKLGRFLEHLCLNNITMDGKRVYPEMVIDAYKKSDDSHEDLGVFYHLIYVKGLMVDGKFVTIETIRDSLKGCHRSLSKFNSYLYQSGKAVKDKEMPESDTVCQLTKANNLWHEFLAYSSNEVSVEIILNAYPDTRDGKRAKAFVLQTIYLNGIHCDILLSAENLADQFEELNDKLALAILYSKLYWYGLGKFRGNPLTLEFISESFPDTRQGTLAKAKFFGDCCIANVIFDVVENDEMVRLTTTVVERLYTKVNATLSFAIFLERLYLKGMKHKRESILPESILMNYRKCCAGLFELGKFYKILCLMGEDINGKSISYEVVRMHMPDSKEGQVCYINFLEKLFFKGSELNGAPLTLTVGESSEASKTTLLAGEAPPVKGRLPELFRAKQGGQLIQAGDVAALYKNGGFDFEYAVFIKNLALSGQLLDGIVPGDQMVLDALSKANARTDYIQIDYLIQRIRIVMEDYFYDAVKMRSLFVDGIIILKKRRLDDKLKVRSVSLKVCALRCNFQNLPETDDKISSGTIMKEIHSIKSPVICARLKFYFLAECYFSNWDFGGQQIKFKDVLDCLDNIPKDSMRYALKRWFEEEDEYLHRANGELDCFFQFSGRDCIKMVAYPSGNLSELAITNSGISEQLSSDSEYFDALTPELLQESCCFQNDINEEKKIDVSKHLRDNSIFTEDALTHYGQADACYQTEEKIKQTGGVLPSSDTVKKESSDLVFGNISGSPFVYNVFKAISEVNEKFANPEIIVFGSLSRLLQNIEKEYNDIDLMGTEKSIQFLIDSIKDEFNNRSCEDVPVLVRISRIEGCMALDIPSIVLIAVSSGCFFNKSLMVECNIFSDDSVAAIKSVNIDIENKDSKFRVKVLSFYDEVVLLGKNIQYMTELLSEESIGRLICNKVKITRTIVFDKHPNVKFRLMMRVMLLLNKAAQFSNILNLPVDHSPFKINDIGFIKKFQELVCMLENKLGSDRQFEEFSREMNSWLSKDIPVYVYQNKRNDFIKKLADKAASMLNKKLTSE